MLGIHLYFNSNFSLNSIDDSEVMLVQGDASSKALYLHFDGIAVNDYGCRIVFERPDLSQSGELYVTPIPSENYYQIVLPAWVTEQEGIVNLTATLKVDEVVSGFGLAPLTVNEGISPSEETICLSEAQYQAILDEFDTIYTDLETRVTKITTIIGIDMQNDILLAEFLTALGNATITQDGLMSKEDKASLSSQLQNIAQLQLDVIANTTAINTKANQTSLNLTNIEVARKAYQTDLDNTNIVVASKANQTDLDNTNIVVDTKVPKVRTIIGLNLEDNVLLEEFKTALGLVTVGLDGLMASEDKRRIDILFAGWGE